MRFVGSLLALALLAACGQGTTLDDASARMIEAAMVTDVPGAAGPILCEGAVRESAPPQCDGRVISNWDWSKVWGASGSTGRQFGEFCLTGKDVGDGFELTARARPVGTCGRPEYLAVAVTVLEDRTHGPQLCLGPIELSMPPQCGGPDVTNWDWARVDSETRRNMTIDGTYDVRGVYVDGDFALTGPPRGWRPSDTPPEGPAERDLTTPCPEPRDGWFPENRTMVAEADRERAIARATSAPTYGELWFDQSHSKVPDENDPSQLILNVRVTKGIAGMQTQLREVWGGALCVSIGRHTDDELRRIQEAAGRRAGALLLESSAGGDQVDMRVVLDEGGKLQKELDEEFGTGTVRVSMALQPASPAV